MFDPMGNGNCTTQSTTCCLGSYRWWRYELVHPIRSMY